MIRKTYLYYMIVICITIISISSCEKDEVFEEEIQSSFKMKGAMSSLSEIKKKDLKLYDYISERNTRINTKSSNSNSGVILDTAHVQVLKGTNYKNYIFRVVADSANNPNILKNYMLVVLKDSIQQQFMVTYPYVNQVVDTTNVSIEPVYGTDILNQVTLKCGGSGSYQSVWIPGSYVDYTCAGREEHSYSQGAECTTYWGKRGSASRIFTAGYFTTQFVEAVPCLDSGDGNPSNGGGGANTDNPPPPVDDDDDDDEGEIDISVGITLNEGSILSIIISDESQDYFDNYLPYDLSQYINDPSKLSLREEIHVFLTLEGFTDENKELIKNFIELNKINNLVRLDRYSSLMEELFIDPISIFNNQIQNNHQSPTNYLDLYNHSIPEICQNKLDSLGQGYINQTIDQGNAMLANIDYYAVEISVMPDLNGDHIPDDPNDVFRKYRQKFMEFASGEHEDFEFTSEVAIYGSITTDISWDFIPIGNDDDSLWQSSNPVSAIFEIDASAADLVALGAVDNGAVIISDYSDNFSWTASTIQTPSTGTQPFSGNRQWGIRPPNRNGNIELYTAAVDIARVSDRIRWDSDTQQQLEDQETDYYNIADATWTNLVNEVIQWIMDNDGVANSSPDNFQHHIDRDQLTEYLEGNITLDQLTNN